MKKIWLAIAGIIVLVATLVMVGCGAANTTTAPGAVSVSNQQQGLWVNGEGKIEIAPDLAIITLGIQSQEVSVADAQAKASEAMDKVIQALKAQGIDDKDIQTQYFNITQVYDYSNSKQTIIGYQVSNTVTVKVHDMAKPGAVIDAVVAAGGDMTRVNGIQFTLEDPSSTYVLARALAMDHAMSKAKEIADKMGVKLGKITYITESSGNNYPVYRNYALSDSAMGAPVPTITLPVSIGQLEITADVQVAYSIN